jgi:hypothetical protein
MHPVHRRRRWFFLPLVVAAIAVFGLVVMLLWNCILPAIAPVKKIDYPRAVGLLLLCRILFGAWGRGGYRMDKPSRGPWQQKWMAMSDEERRQFRQAWRERCAGREDHSDQGTTK